MINPQSGIALYRQLAALLRADIITGRRRPGQTMPSERTLTQEYGLSRDTVRSAIGQLRAEGLVTMRRGRGAVVKEIPPRQVLTPPAGATVTTRMPTLEERAELGLGEGVPIFWVVTSDGSASGYPGDRWELYWA